MPRRSLRACAQLAWLVLAVAFLAHTARAATVTHIYELNGSYADSLGGPRLVPTGGTLTATDYVFGNPANRVNEGLSLTNAITDADDYAIEMQFRWTGDDYGWGRILDFHSTHGSSPDAGIYTRSSTNQLIAWRLGHSPASVAPMSISTDYHLVLTRDGATKTFTAFLNGTPQFQFVDASDEAVFSSPGNLVDFFLDDGGAGDTRPGIVDQIRVFDGPLNSIDVTTLFTGNGLSRAPRASMASTYAITDGDMLLLDASHSYDPDQEFGDSIAQYEWDLDGDGTFDFSSGTPILSLLSSQYAGLLAGGTNAAQLRVTDTIGRHTGLTPFNIEFTTVPEPSSLSLFCVAAVACAVGCSRRWRRRASRTR